MQRSHRKRLRRTDRDTGYRSRGHASPDLHPDGAVRLGRSPWETLAGRPVTCLSLRQQLALHTGYESRDDLTSGTMANTPDFDRLLRDGATVTYLRMEWTVSRRDAGTLVLPSGQVVVGDPLTMGAGVDPLAVTVAPGRYPVVSFVLQDPPSRPRTHDVAYSAVLQLVVRDEPVVAWEPAAWRGDDPGGTGSVPAGHGRPTSATGSHRF